MTQDSDTPHTHPSPSALRLLGHFGLRIGEETVYVPPTAQRVLAYLALHVQGVGREHMAELLWPGLPPSRAGASLRSALWRIARRSDRGAVVELWADRLRIADHVLVDLRRATHYATGLANGTTAAVPGAQVPAQLREEILPAWYDDWLTDAREHFHQIRLHALEAVSRHHRHQGNMCAALMYAMTAVQAEPLRESAHREVTAVHLAEGNTAEALRHFESYRHRLRDQLGLPPSTEYRRLLEPHLGRPLPVGRG
ncbi:BTAD domain-containing putative transcriptional regulator [Streptomyces griseoluteus]|uniref:AfsR/SARP family transcriptional regulator n=1 Tax=Streptomyces griseoluteus TaxID=29306 RepID=UPI0033FAD472